MISTPRTSPAPTPRGASRASAARARLTDLLPATALFVLVIFLWEVGLTVLEVKQFLLPRPSVIVGALVGEWSVLGRGVMYTGFEALVGLLLGTTLGVLAAFATGRWASARATLMPLAVAASSVPISPAAPGRLSTTNV